METQTYRGSLFRIFRGHETRQINGHTTAPALAECWYWEPKDYEGDVLYSDPSPDGGEAMLAAEEAYDSGDWS